jgi:hypothetical protein
MLNRRRRHQQREPELAGKDEIDLTVLSPEMLMFSSATEPACVYTTLLSW